MTATEVFFNVDVESSDSSLFRGQLLSIGVVPVYRNSGGVWVIDERTFYLRLVYDANRMMGQDSETLRWWRGQGFEAQCEAFSPLLERVAPVDAAWMLDAWVREIAPDPANRIFTANPVSFDKPWIDRLFEEFGAGVENPFHYRSLCLRSMRFGADPSRSFNASRDGHKSFIPHQALEDARAQALDLLDMLNGTEVPEQPPRAPRSRKRGTARRSE